MKRTRLLQARLAKGWSQEQAAEAVDVGRKTYGLWELGKCQPYPLYVKRLCDLFALSDQELDLAPGRTEERNLDSDHLGIDVIANGIASCNALAYESVARNDLRHTMQIVDSYAVLLQPLLASSQRLQAAALMSRVFQLRQGAAYNFVGATGSIEPARQAVEFARMAEVEGIADLNNALRQLSSSYEWPGDLPVKKRRELGLMLSEEAVYLSEKHRHIVPHDHQARSYTGHAKFLALTGQGQAAISALGKSREVLAKKSSADIDQRISGDYITEHNHIRQEAIVWSYLNDQPKAVELFMSLFSTTGNGIAPRNPLPARMYASMISEVIISLLRLPNSRKDRELTTAFWLAGLAAAQPLQSVTYRKEAGISLQIMECVWPEDSRIMELRDVLNS
jgi:DNA-binding XRE family transcriptional regulator